VGVTAEKEAIVFLHALEDAAIELEDVHVIALEISPRAKNDSRFIRAAEERSHSVSPAPWGSFAVIDVSPSLEPRHYFMLDDHMNASGHERVTTVLAREVSRACTPLSDSGRLTAPAEPTVQ
jgi:hypothetical protein